MSASGADGASSLREAWGEAEHGVGTPRGVKSLDSPVPTPRSTSGTTQQGGGGTSASAVGAPQGGSAPKVGVAGRQLSEKEQEEATETARRQLLQAQQTAEVAREAAQRAVTEAQDAATKATETRSTARSLVQERRLQTLPT